MELPDIIVLTWDNMVVWIPLSVVGCVQERGLLKINPQPIGGEFPMRIPARLVSIFIQARSLQTNGPV